MRRVFLPGIVLAAFVVHLSPVHAALEPEEKAARAYQEGETARRSGKYEDAARLYRRTLEIFPAHATAFERLREVYQGGDAQATLATIRVLEAEVAGQQGDFIAWNLLGVLYGRERRWDEALAAFAESVKAEPRAADTLVNRGWVLMELRRYDEAAAAFEAALELQPRLARAQAGLGSVLVESKGDYAGGVKHYLTAVRLDPDNARLLNDLGWLSYKMSRYPEAVAALEKAALLDPRSPMIQTNLGLAYQKAGRVEEAVHHLQQALAINAEYTLALYGLGKAYESRKEYAAAGRVYHRAWKQSGNDVYLLLWLQAYMASHGQVVILFLFAFLAVVVVIALRALRARRTLAATKG